MAKHSYTITCECKRCTRERARRSAQSASHPSSLKARKVWSRSALQRVNRRPDTRVASRAEQHARYIDCGPQAWDDR